MPSLDETASRLVRPPQDPAPPGSAYLLVVENDTSSIVNLPRTGAVVIGRSSEGEVVLNHASVSRRHATIRIENGGFSIADLGSHNGTRVNGELVQESRMLASGDVVSVGDQAANVVMVLHVSNPPVVSRAAYAETGWRRRLAEEMDRAITYHRSLAVIAIAGATPATVGELANGLRVIDVVGECTDGNALLLLPEVDRDQARAIAEAALEKTTTPVRAGLAMCPGDACDADTILLAARSAASKARPGRLVESTEAVKRIELGSRHVLVMDPGMARVYALLERVAKSHLPVLVTGEMGVGKENAAYAVHHYSGRTGEFLAQNCGAIAESLAESLLFGHEKGAFTNANTAKAGMFEAAAGGTLFLDEIGELSLALQAKLLRALESKTIQRVGDTKERAIDVRIVAATNRNLDEEARAGRFRADLLFRIRGAQVILPPLRDRRCEIAMLAREFLAAACTAGGRPEMTITADAMQVLLTYAWPGNVRELKTTMDYVAVTAPDDRVEPSDLPATLVGSAATPAPVAVVEAAPQPSTPATFRPIAEELRELERRRMSEALAAAGGVRTRAAQLIEMPIRTFTLKLKQYNLP